MPVNTVAPLVYRDLRQWTWIPRACGEAAPPWFLWYQMIYSSMDGAGEVGLCEFIYIYSAVVTGETLGCLRISILAFAFFQLDVTLFGVFSICNLPTVMTSHKSVSAFFIIFFSNAKWILKWWLSVWDLYSDVIWKIYIFCFNAIFA